MDTTTIFRLNNIVFIPEKKTLFSKEQRFSLEPKEVRVLSTLFNAKENYVSVEQFKQDAWDGIFVCPHAIYRIICKLRKKLQLLNPEIEHIQTYRRKGYRLQTKLASTRAEVQETCLTEKRAA